MPIAAPSFSLGTIRYRIVKQVTGSTPPGMACKIRKKIMLFRSPAIPHSAENAENEISAITYNRFRPTRSPNQALVGTITPKHNVYAVLTHWILSVVALNCFCIVGIATFTMLVSRVDMNMPTTTTARGRPHFAGCGDSVGARDGSLGTDRIGGG